VKLNPDHRDFGAIFFCRLLCMIFPSKDRNLLLFNRGVSPGFENIYSDLLAPLRAQVERWVGNRDKSVDICSHTFVQLWKARGKFSSMEKVRAFVYKTARHAVLDYLRKRKQIPLSDTRILEDFISPEFPRFENKDQLAHLIRMLDSIISKLSPRSAQVVRLAYFDDLRNQEIAALLGIREKTVRNIKNRSLKKLRIQFRENPHVVKSLEIWGLQQAVKI
jgi:RNA polymerase sigma factor (sigma-70 family)